MRVVKEVNEQVWMVVLKEEGDQRDLHRVDRRKRQMCIRDRNSVEEEGEQQVKQRLKQQTLQYIKKKKQRTKRRSKQRKQLNNQLNLPIRLHYVLLCCARH